MFSPHAISTIFRARRIVTTPIVIANRGAKSASAVDEDLGFVAVNATVPGLGNRGVTGSAPVAFLNLSLPEHGYHAPNENFDWGQAAGGMAAFARYLEAVAEGRRAEGS